MARAIATEPILIVCPRFKVQGAFYAAQFALKQLPLNTSKIQSNPEIGGV